MQANVDLTLQLPHGSAEGAEQLRGALETHAREILDALAQYVARSGLGHGREAAEVAAELLGEVAVEALSHADRYDPARQPLPWLLGIGANLVKRRLVKEAKHQRREPRIQDLMALSEQSMNEEDLFDLLCEAASPPASTRLETQARIDSLLALVPEEDRHVIRLAVLLDLDGEAVARELGIKPGAARTRLCRALARLRQALAAQAQQAGSQDNE